jgi:heme A synthase
MKQYKIYKHPSGTVEVVKQGWSWPAFFFALFWALAKRLWVAALGVLAVLIVIALIFGKHSAEEAVGIIINLVGLIIQIIFGARGNSWRGKNLASRGYEHVDTVTASNTDGALALYLKPEKKE